jgi:hypothetical protein
MSSWTSRSAFTRGAPAVLVVLLAAVPALAIEIFWSGRPDDEEFRAILSRDLAGDSGDRVLVQVERRVGSIVIDDEARKMYWVQPGDGRVDSEVWRAELDGSEVELFWSTPDPFVTLAVDSVGGHLYVGVSDGVRRLRLDNGEVTVLFRGTGISKLVIDVDRATLLWIAPAPVKPGRYAPPSIWRWELLAEDAELIFRPRTLTGDLGLALDPTEGKVYWAAVDYGDCRWVERIQRGNYDGSGVEVVFCGGPKLDDWPTEIAIDPASGTIFWQNSEITPVFAFNIDSATNEEVFRVGSLESMTVGPAPLPSDPRFLRGDIDGDGSAQLTDAVGILDWLFRGAARLGCLSSADTNADAAIDLTDATFLLNHLFLGGQAPPPPFPTCDVSDLPSDATFGCEQVSKECARP